MLDFIVGSVPETMLIPVKRLIPISLKRWVLSQLAQTSKSDTFYNEEHDLAFLSFNDRMFGSMLLNGTYEPEWTRQMKRFVLPGDTVIDVGANFGWYTNLFGKLVSDTGTVVSFEPNDEIVDILKSNVSLNKLDDVVQVKELGISDKQGNLYFSVNAGQSGLAEVTSEKTDLSIQVSTLNIELQYLVGKISFVKVDVEGHELEVLRGGVDLFAHVNRPNLMVEFNPNDSRIQEHIQFMNDFAKEYQYSIFCLQSDELVELTAFNNTVSYGNFLFIATTGLYSLRIDS